MLYNNKAQIEKKVLRFKKINTHNKKLRFGNSRHILHHKINIFDIIQS